MKVFSYMKGVILWYSNSVKLPVELKLFLCLIMLVMLIMLAYLAHYKVKCSEQTLRGFQVH